MTRKPPLPICKAFLTCREVATDQKYGGTSILGLCSQHVHHHFPSGSNVGIFVRLTSAHGDYKLEVQLQTAQGDVVWKDGPETPYSLPDPLHTCDFKFNVCIVFPKPAWYDLVLLVNGEELARERYHACMKLLESAE